MGDNRRFSNGISNHIVVPTGTKETRARLFRTERKQTIPEHDPVHETRNK